MSDHPEDDPLSQTPADRDYYEAWYAEQGNETVADACHFCGKEFEDFSDLGCEVCDSRHPGFVGNVV